MIIGGQSNANATEAQIRHRLESHLVPFDTLVDGNFRAFMDARARLIHASLEQLCEGSVP